MEHNRELRSKFIHMCPINFWQKCKSNSVEEGCLPFQQMVLEQLDNHRQKYEPQFKFCIFYKNQIKMDHGLRSVRQKIIKLLETILGENL